MQHVEMIGMDSTQTGLLCRLALTRLIIAMGIDNYNTTYTPFFPLSSSMRQTKQRGKNMQTIHTHHLCYTDKVIDNILLLNGFSALE